MPVEILTTQASFAMADTEPDYSVYENKTGLADDLKFLASMPELCDVTFLVGDTREPVCAVKVKNPVEYTEEYPCSCSSSSSPSPSFYPFNNFFFHFFVLLFVLPRLRSRTLTNYYLLLHALCCYSRPCS